MPARQAPPTPTGANRAHRSAQTAARRLRVGAAAVLPLLLVAGCAVEIENRRAAEEVARLAAPPGSTYLGWRVYQNKCATCHGPAAGGTANAPDLLPRVRDMGARQFASIVLRRYDWSAVATQARGDGAALDALIDKIVQRQDYPLTMPAMAGEPSVNAHLVDLYAYLSARATGAQGPDRPSP